MNHSVVFLILTCEFVLLDLAFSIVVGMCAHYETILCSAIHCLSIHIVVWLLVLYQPSLLLPCLEVLDCLVICRLAVLIDHRVEVDFWLSDVKE